MMRGNERRMVSGHGGSAVGVVYVVVTPEQINTINVSPGAYKSSCQLPA